MTTPKTSIEKLVTRNSQVSDERSALLATRWKWREIRTRAHELYGLIDHACGFCRLAMIRQRSAVKAIAKCNHCPTQVGKFCQELQRQTTGIESLLEEELDSVLEFLSGLKERELADDKGRVPTEG